MTEIIMTILIVLSILSVAINVILYKTSMRQLKKVDLYEVWIKEYDTWIDEFRNQVLSTYLKMKSIDDKNLFVKDDDVGVVFQELLSLLKQLNDKVKK